MNAVPEDTERQSCQICKGPVYVERTLFDDRYGYPGTHDLVRCDACGHRSLQFFADDAALERLYTQYYPRSQFDMSDWRPAQELSAFHAWLKGAKSSAFRWVPGGSRVLDIGCGFCEALGFHRKRGSDATGVEVDANAQRIAEREGFDVHLGTFQPEMVGQRRFDYVTLDQVIEHAANPVKLLNDCRETLSPSGTIVVSTPCADGWGGRLFGNRWVHWHAPYHLQFFTSESMRLAARQAGLEIAEERCVTPNDWLLFQVDHLAAPTTPGRPSAFWSRRIKRPGLQRMAFAVAAICGRLGMFAVFTRIADLCDRGDNRVYLLRRPDEVVPIRTC